MLTAAWIERKRAARKVPPAARRDGQPVFQTERMSRGLRLVKPARISKAPSAGMAGSFGSRLFEDGERLVAMFGEVLLALDGTVPPASMDGEGGVSQGGEGLGGVAGSGAAGVLAAGPIADVGAGGSRFPNALA